MGDLKLLNWINVPEILVDNFLHSGQLLWLRNYGHAELMLQRAGLQHLEGRLADQYRLAVLDGLHRANSEAAAISGAVHLVQHWNLWVPC